MTRRTQTRKYYTVTVTALHIRHEVRVHDVGRIMISVFSGPGCLGAPTCDPMGLLAPPQWLAYRASCTVAFTSMNSAEYSAETTVESFGGGFFDRVVRLHLSSTSASLHRRLLV